jgi:hypothetical protein
LRRLNDITGLILLYGFFFVAGATPFVLVGLSVINFLRNAPRRTAIVLKTLGALTIWGSLTFTDVTEFIMIAVSYSTPQSSSRQDLMLHGIFAAEALVYLAVSVLLIYWMWRQRKLVPQQNSG